MNSKVASRSLLGVALLAMAFPAYAQDDTREGIALQNQILELRHDVDSLRDQVAAGAASGAAPAPVRSPDVGMPGANPDAMTALLDRVTQLEDQVRSLQGAADETRNTLTRQNADLAKQIGDLGFRVQALEGGAPPAAAATSSDASPSAVPPLVPGSASRGVPPGARPAASTAAPALGLHPSLQQGYAALARRDYAGAEAAARDTLANPRSPRAYDAQFLLAQSLAGQHAYQPAALAFDDAYNRQRKGSHAPDALVGLAGALAAIGEKPAACATLDKLRAEFPSQRSDLHANAAAVARRAGCH